MLLLKSFVSVVICYSSSRERTQETTHITRECATVTHLLSSEWVHGGAVQMAPPLGPYDPTGHMTVEVSMTKYL